MDARCMTYLNFKATHVNMNVLRTGTAPGIGVKDGGMGTSASKVLYNQFKSS